MHLEVKSFDLTARLSFKRYFLTYWSQFKACNVSPQEIVIRIFFNGTRGRCRKSAKKVSQTILTKNQCSQRDLSKNIDKNSPEDVTLRIEWEELRDLESVSRLAPIQSPISLPKKWSLPMQLSIPKVAPVMKSHSKDHSSAYLRRFVYCSSTLVQGFEHRWMSCTG